MRRKGERTVALYSITYSPITKCEPDPRNSKIYSTHTEQAQAIWAKGQMTTTFKNVPAGSTINIMIFTQAPPCPERCQGGLPGWIQDIKKAAPKGTFVNVYVWYQTTFNKDNPLGNPPQSENDVTPYGTF